MLRKKKQNKNYKKKNAVINQKNISHILCAMSILWATNGNHATHNNNFDLNLFQLVSCGVLNHASIHPSVHPSSDPNIYSFIHHIHYNEAHRPCLLSNTYDDIASGNSTHNCWICCEQLMFVGKLQTPKNGVCHVWRRTIICPFGRIIRGKLYNYEKVWEIWLI